MSRTSGQHPATLQVYTNVIGCVMQFWQRYGCVSNALSTDAWRRTWDADDYYMLCRYMCVERYGLVSGAADDGLTCLAYCTAYSYMRRVAHVVAVLNGVDHTVQLKLAVGALKRVATLYPGMQKDS